MAFSKEAVRVKIAEDAEFIADQRRWPQSPLCLKTQPWVEPQVFATISESDMHPDGSCRVVERDGVNSWTYDSIEDAAQKWAVD